MAIAKDIRIAIGFLDHPKTMKLRRRLGCEGVEALMRLWCFAAQCKTDGLLSEMTDEDLELAARWQGEPGALLRELCDLRFLDLDVEAGWHRLHDWQEHNGYVFHTRDREDKARRAAKARHAKSAEARGEDGVPAGSGDQAEAPARLRTSDARPKTSHARIAVSPAPSPSPSPVPSPAPSPAPDPVPAPVPAPAASAKGGEGAGARPADFEAFWNAYPRRKSLPRTREAWDHAASRGELPPLATLLRVLEAQKRQPSWNRDQMRYVPDSVTWITGQRWTDDLEPAPAAPLHSLLAARRPLPPPPQLPRTPPSLRLKEPAKDRELQGA